MLMLYIPQSILLEIVIRVSIPCIVRVSYRESEVNNTFYLLHEYM